MSTFNYNFPNVTIDLDERNISFGVDKFISFESKSVNQSNVLNE